MIDPSQLIIIKFAAADGLPTDLANNELQELKGLEFADLITAAAIEELEGASVEETVQQVVDNVPEADQIDDQDQPVVVPIAVAMMPLENPVETVDQLPLPSLPQSANLTNKPGVNNTASLPTIDAPFLFTEIDAQLSKIETANKIALPQASQKVNPLLEPAEPVAINLIDIDETMINKEVSVKTSAQSLPVQVEKLINNSSDNPQSNANLANPAAVRELPAVSTNHAVPAPSYEMTVPTSITHADWGNDVNEQIVWLGQQKINSAIIKLHPEEFGPLEVSIKLVKDDARLTITTHSAPVRDLLELSMPRLKEMMADQGVNLTQVNVESNKNQQQTGSHSGQSVPQSQANTDEQTIIASTVIKQPQGIIDYFA